MPRIIVIATMILLSSCAGMSGIEVRNPFVNPETEDYISHQPWPDVVTPLPKNIIKTVVYKDVDGSEKSITGFSWDDQQTFRIWEESREEHTQLLEKLLCYYRKELEEERCQRYTNND